MRHYEHMLLKGSLIDLHGGNTRVQLDPRQQRIIRLVNLSLVMPYSATAMLRRRVALLANSGRYHVYLVITGGRALALEALVESLWRAFDIRYEICVVIVAACDNLALVLLLTLVNCLFTLLLVK